MCNGSLTTRLRLNEKLSTTVNGQACCSTEGTVFSGSSSDELDPH